MMTPKDLLDTMLGVLGFVVDIEETTNEGGNATLQIYTEESRRLIGRDGETLEAIQFLLNRLLQARDKDAEKVIVDCEHYRSMREDRIVQRVRELAERVRITGRSLQLEPMNSYERRLVHNAFKDDPEVATWSPSDSARIKQITLLKRPKKQHRKERRLPSRRVFSSRFAVRSAARTRGRRRLLKCTCIYTSIRLILVRQNIRALHEHQSSHGAICCISLSLLRPQDATGRGGFEICPVCFWQDDGQDDHDADEVRGGPNRDLSLSQACRNYRELGASDRRDLPCALAYTGRALVSTYRDPHFSSNHAMKRTATRIGSRLKEEL